MSNVFTFRPSSAVLKAITNTELPILSEKREEEGDQGSKYLFSEYNI